MKIPFYFLASWICLAALMSPLFAQEIRPDQVLIIGNRQNPESGRLAHLYALGRKIPPRNIILLDLTDLEEISRPQYNQQIAGPIRQFLHMMKLEQKIKILVTMYGVPLKVSPVQPTLSQRNRAQQIKQNYFDSFTELETTYRELEKMAGIPTTLPTVLAGKDRIEQFAKDFPLVAGNIQTLYRKIIYAIQHKKDQAEKERDAERFLKLRLVLEGEMGIFMMMQNAPAVHKAEALERITGLEKEFYSMLALLPDRRDLDKTYKLAGELGGLFLKLRTIHEDYGRLMQIDSLAAVDSELTLVLWKDPVLAGRLPNGLNPRFAQNPMTLGKGPILMVSRLDGPTPRIVERMIRDALETEKKGLTGKFYIDARGIKSKDGYFQYDEDLRNLARQMEELHIMPVVLDDKPEVFKPGTCPNTALYCGWYSLRNYVPAFTFEPGSVGYHIASFEAVSLKDSKNNQWVKRMLENGICATLGPVDEPFLDSFPLPSEFFGLLLTGKYNLAETFFRTNRYNSWRMILIGDPLYNPFASRPLIKESNVQMKPLNLLLLQ
jgi:uncharacterized protein (TIGR03790 family)